MSAGVIESIVNSFMSQAETRRVSGEVTVRQLLASGLVTPQQLAGLTSALAGPCGLDRRAPRRGQLRPGPRLCRAATTESNAGSS